jgi:Cu(I)/Ag(I) efflux system membrane fusion protein
MTGSMTIQKIFARLLVVAALMVAGTVSAAVKPELTIKPDPPEAGENVLRIKITDDAGKPVDGAKLDLLVFMPAMATMPRMEEKTKIETKGSGLYEATFDLPMGGTWEIVLTVDKDGVKDVSHHSLTTGVPGVASKGSGRGASGGEGESATNLMDLGPGRLQQIGVRFAEAKTVSMNRNVEAVGVVEQDQTHREEVTLRFPGYVIKQFRGRVGDSVKAGDPLFSVYSPDLVTAQSELVLADKIAGGGQSLHHAASEKLKNLGLSEREIAQIRKQGKPLRDVVVRAKVSGTILDVTAREGAAVRAGQVVYVIGDLSKSYIVARVFQQDVGDLKLGQSAEVAVPGTSGQSMSGKIDLIYPQIEQGAGTANVRVEVTEFAADLRPGIYLDVRFPVELGSLLAIPAEAVLYSGRHRYVFIDRGEGALEPREIDVGKTTDGLVEVKGGLKEGDRVVASGTFLLGSEAQLRSALPKWKDERAQGEIAKDEVPSKDHGSGMPGAMPGHMMEQGKGGENK